MPKNRAVRVIATAAAIGFAGSALADYQAAIDGSIDQLRTIGGPHGQAGEVVSSEFSLAGTFLDGATFTWDETNNGGNGGWDFVA